MTGIRIHATNIVGTGAIQLYHSLFPELVRTSEVRKAYVSPEVEAVTLHAAADTGTEVYRMSRRLPNAISRALECTVFAKQFQGEGVLLVLGDVPLGSAIPQVVFVHSPHFIKAHSRFQPKEWKYILARALFKLNAPNVVAFIVQTQVMKESLEASFPALNGRVYIIPQPPPEWVLAAPVQQTRADPHEGLRLIYPAAKYGHKNHDLLRRLRIDEELKKALKQITLTISPNDHPGLQSEYVHCIGLLGEAEMIRQYDMADALLFLSKKESYGFPLLEAMWLKMPIICPDLPYARWMCGQEAVYFDPESPQSLQAAILKTHTLLMNGWRPDWSEQIKKIPKNWSECAQQFLKLCE